MRNNRPCKEKSCFLSLFFLLLILSQTDIRSRVFFGLQVVKLKSDNLQKKPARSFLRIESTEKQTLPERVALLLSQMSRRQIGFASKGPFSPRRRSLGPGYEANFKALHRAQRASWHDA